MQCDAHSDTVLKYILWKRFDKIIGKSLINFTKEAKKAFKSLNCGGKPYFTPFFDWGIPLSKVWGGMLSILASEML